MKNIAVFASGGGSNAEQLVKYFSKSPLARVAVVICNNNKAGVIEKCKSLSVPCMLIQRAEVNQKTVLLPLLEKYQTDFIVLAGFLQKLPFYLIEAFPNRIINLHPALLPKYGGKGMYGENVHKAVLANRESHTGISIHYVNENYDEGNIIFQKDFEIDKDDTLKSLQQKIQKLEHKYLPEITEKLIKDLTNEF